MSWITSEREGGRGFSFCHLMFPDVILRPWLWGQLCELWQDVATDQQCHLSDFANNLVSGKPPATCESPAVCHWFFPLWVWMLLLCRRFNFWQQKFCICFQPKLRHLPACVTLPFLRKPLLGKNSAASHPNTSIGDLRLGWARISFTAWHCSVVLMSISHAAFGFPAESDSLWASQGRNDSLLNGDIYFISSLFGLQFVLVAGGCFQAFVCG